MAGPLAASGSQIRDRHWFPNSVMQVVPALRSYVNVHANWPHPLLEVAFLFA